MLSELNASVSSALMALQRRVRREQFHKLNRTQRMPLKGECGFTLIELLTVIAILGVLAGLSLQGFALYRPLAAFAAVQSSTDNVIKAHYAATANPGVVFPEIEDEPQDTPGPLSNAVGRSLFPGFVVGRSMQVIYTHYPDCTIELGCTDVQTRVEVRHRQGAKFLRWTRFGDGIEIKLEVPGAGLAP